MGDLVEAGGEWSDREHGPKSNALVVNLLLYFFHFSLQSFSLAKSQPQPLSFQVQGPQGPFPLAETSLLVPLAQPFQESLQQSRSQARLPFSFPFPIAFRVPLAVAARRERLLAAARQQSSSLSVPVPFSVSFAIQVPLGLQVCLSVAAQESRWRRRCDRRQSRR